MARGACIESVRRGSPSCAPSSTTSGAKGSRASSRRPKRTIGLRPQGAGVAVDRERLPVEREVRIEAPPDVVFKFFVEPEQMIRWTGVEATLDPRPGGIYRVNVTGEDVARG